MIGQVFAVVVLAIATVLVTALAGPVGLLFFAGVAIIMLGVRPHNAPEERLHGGIVV